MNTIELRKTGETKSTETLDELVNTTEQMRQELSQLRGQLSEIINQMPRGKAWAASS
jgi:hypothetical protein